MRTLLGLFGLEPPNVNATLKKTYKVLTKIQLKLYNYERMAATNMKLINSLPAAMTERPLKLCCFKSIAENSD